MFERRFRDLCVELGGEVQEEPELSCIFDEQGEEFRSFAVWLAKNAPSKGAFKAKNIGEGEGTCEEISIYNGDIYFSVEKRHNLGTFETISSWIEEALSEKGYNENAIDSALANLDKAYKAAADAVSNIDYSKVAKPYILQNGEVECDVVEDWSWDTVYIVCRAEVKVPASTVILRTLKDIERAVNTATSKSSEVWYDTFYDTVFAKNRS